MRKLYHALDRFCGNRWFPMLFIPLAASFLLLYSYTTSPLFLNDGMDSAVFKTMGLAILKGKIPYVDIFDHKGPILYFINALGQWMIPGRMGIFLLQVVGLSIAIVYMFKAARLFVGNALSFLAVLFTLFIFGGLIQEGNQCEEWMMYFFTVALYYALKYVVNHSDMCHPLKYSLLYGFCFGMMFFIRPNDAVAMMGGLMTGVAIWLVYKKEYRNAFLNALCFAAGFLLVVVPIVCYFAWHNALGDLWYGLVGYNKGYTGGMVQLLSALATSLKLELIMVFTVLVAIAYSAGKKRVMWILLPMVAFYAILLGTQGFPHYYTVLLPLYSLFLAIAFSQGNLALKVASIAVVLLSGHIGYGQSIVRLSIDSSVGKAKTLSHGVRYQRVREFYSETDKLLSHIPEEERGSVWNYNLRWEGGGNEGMRSAISSLWRYGIVQCNVITFAESDLLKEKDDITKKKPTWLLVDAANVETADKVMEEFIPLYYDLVATTDTTICSIQLYRRK